MTSVFNQTPVLLAKNKPAPAVKGRPTGARQPLSVKVLILLALDPTRRLHASEIARRCKVDRKRICANLYRSRSSGWIVYEDEKGAWADPVYRAGPKLLEMLGVLK